MTLASDTTVTMSFFFTFIGVLVTGLYTYFSDKGNVTKLTERINNISDNVDANLDSSDKKIKDLKDTLTNNLEEIKILTKEREDRIENKLETFKNSNSIELVELKKNINDERLKATETFFKRTDELRDNLRNTVTDVAELSTKVIHLEKNIFNDVNKENILIEVAVLKEKISHIKERMNEKFKI